MDSTDHRELHEIAKHGTRIERTVPRAFIQCPQLTPLLLRVVAISLPNGDDLRLDRFEDSLLCQCAAGESEREREQRQP